ncbi:MAG: hypothetical protein N2235_20155 [Fischerella sp.]|nr:hypothetical protein [Fischerella sp.]
MSYTTPNQQVVMLGRELGSGGEGAVYEIIGQPELVAKVYQASRRTPERERKLLAMVANPPQDDTRRLSPPHVSIAWPVDLLYEKQQFAGYIMPRISQSPNIYEVYNPQSRAEKYAEFSWQYLHRTAKNLAIALNALHARGYVMGDINPKNVLVTTSALVTLVDTDSFQVRDVRGHVYRCPVGMPEYTPPELQGVQLDAIDRSSHHDAFGLAVIIFQLLMEGFHPFTGAPKDPTRSIMGGNFCLYCIKNGVFPYHSQNRDFKPPPGAPDFTILYPRLQKLFLRCFVDGHKDPSARPTAREWIDALSEAESALVQCKQNYLHWHSNHLKECPWCERWPTQQPMPGISPYVSGVVTVVTGGQTSFIFPDGKTKATTPQELVRLIDVHWQVSRECLEKGYFEQWLGGIGRADLARLAQNALAKHKGNLDLALEVFAQDLATALGIDLPRPVLQASPTLDFGRVEPIVSPPKKVVVIENSTRRGYISAEVATDAGWLRITPQRISIIPPVMATAITVWVDPSELGGGHNQAKITITPTSDSRARPISISVTSRASFPYKAWIWEMLKFGVLWGVTGWVVVSIAFLNVRLMSWVLGFGIVMYAGMTLLLRNR